MQCIRIKRNAPKSAYICVYIYKATGVRDRTDLNEFGMCIYMYICTVGQSINQYAIGIMRAMGTCVNM